ncbi:DNA alkylation repair protein [Halovulum dunhuangense]|uniref:DNA alkylation repair protein n=1 Tax=Halovulum dunhuangense TaxID=1505036 RepID=A0A849L3W1_9RHOB|nr:DNA alkylation repair protein [Halovulum dunhuangense]NNU81098.1 DNA alkylation repair protein [Halovulum dunhuangense]
MRHDSALLPRLAAMADPARAGEMAEYHKTRRPVLGVSNPQIIELVGGWRAERAVCDWVREAQALWTSGIFEARIAAGKLLVKARIPDPEMDQAVWETVAAWAPDFDGWAIADHAAEAGSRRVMADLSRLDRLEGWLWEENVWMRRAALVFSLPLAKLNHPSQAEAAARARVLGWAARLTADRDWFIQKAIATWLRTLAKHDADAVRGFLAAHGAALKAFARREAERGLA